MVFQGHGWLSLTPRVVYLWYVVLVFRLWLKIIFVLEKPHRILGPCWHDSSVTFVYSVYRRVVFVCTVCCACTYIGVDLFGMCGRCCSFSSGELIVFSRGGVAPCKSLWRHTSTTPCTFSATPLIFPGISVQLYTCSNFCLYLEYVLFSLLRYIVHIVFLFVLRMTVIRYVFGFICWHRIWDWLAIFVLFRHDRLEYQPLSWNILSLPSMSWSEMDVYFSSKRYFSIFINEFHIMWHYVRCHDVKMPRSMLAVFRFAYLVISYWAIVSFYI